MHSKSKQSWSEDFGYTYALGFMTSIFLVFWLLDVCLLPGFAVFLRSLQISSECEVLMLDRPWHVRELFRYVVAWVRGDKYFLDVTFYIHSHKENFPLVQGLPIYLNFFTWKILPLCSHTLPNQFKPEYTRLLIILSNFLKVLPICAQIFIIWVFFILIWIVIIIQHQSKYLSDIYIGPSFIHSLISFIHFHSSNKYSLSIHYVPSTLLRAGDKMMSNSDLILPSLDLTVEWGRQTLNQ